MKSVTGHLQKMATHYDPENSNDPVGYSLTLDNSTVGMNALIGQNIRMEFLGAIHCTHCGRKTNKSFSQGYCYPCFKRLPECDQCIMSPEKCHYHLGTCRDPSWGDDFCMQDHIVYLANSSGVKVGITRGTRLLTRWCDQGAIQGIPVFRVKTRQLSGLIEHLYRQEVADKTNWRAMLKGQVDNLDLGIIRNELYERFRDQTDALEREHGPGSVQYLEGHTASNISYPVLQYPVKISSLNFDKNPVISGMLHGIKGQYLIMDCGVINLRKFTAYNIEFSFPGQEH